MNPNLLQGIAAIILIALAGLGWAGYFITFQGRMKDRDRLPDNIKKLYYSDFN
jgi:hypothetical protein